MGSKRGTVGLGMVAAARPGEMVRPAAMVLWCEGFVLDREVDAGDAAPHLLPTDA